MGLKKIFSSSSTKEKDFKKHNSNRSSLSLFTQKENKRSSTISFPSRSNKIIQNERHGIILNESPSSIIHKKDITYPIRNSTSSETTTHSEDGKHTQFMTISSPTHQNRQSQEFCAPNYHRHDNNAINASRPSLWSPLAAYDSATIADTNLENKGSLTNELLSVQHLLTSFHSQNLNDIKLHLANVNDALSKALYTSTHLESKTKSIMSHSKNVILQLEEKLELAKKEHELLIQEHHELQRTFNELTVTYDNTAQVIRTHPLYNNDKDLQANVEHLVFLLLKSQQEKTDLEKEYRISQEKASLQAIIHQDALKQEKMLFSQEKERLLDVHTQEKQQLREIYEQEKQQWVEEEKRRLHSQFSKEDLIEQFQKKEHGRNRDRRLEYKENAPSSADSNLPFQYTADDVRKPADDERVVVLLQDFLTKENQMLKERIAEMEQATMREKHILEPEEKKLLNKEKEYKRVDMDRLQEENESLQETVVCLQAKLKELVSAEEEDVKQSKMRQEELMQMHTRAQLSLIEYLEGEPDVLSAMIKFKKQLEAELL